MQGDDQAAEGDGQAAEGYADAQGATSVWKTATTRASRAATSRPLRRRHRWKACRSSVCRSKVRPFDRVPPVNVEAAPPLPPAPEPVVTSVPQPIAIPEPEPVPAPPPPPVPVIDAPPESPSAAGGVARQDVRNASPLPDRRCRCAAVRRRATSIERCRRARRRGRSIPGQLPSMEALRNGDGAQQGATALPYRRGQAENQAIPSSAKANQFD